MYIKIFSCLNACGKHMAKDIDEVYTKYKHLLEL